MVRVEPHLTAAAETDLADAARLGDLPEPKAAVVRAATPAARTAATRTFLMFPSY
jgi:hypothetical protein